MTSEHNREPHQDDAEGITDVAGRDASKLLHPDGRRRQSLAGFDDDYVDIVDYIVRCTHKIWEEKGIGLIYTHYRHNVIVHTTGRTVYGRDQVIADSIKTMSAFPDIRLYADEVIWSGNDRDGFHSSHRIVWVGHNTGYSIYGPPTGRKVVRQGIAHCLVKENRIVEEWIARDELALIRQLGFDEHELARRFAAQDAASGVHSSQPLSQGDVERVAGQTTPEALPPPSAGFDIEDFVVRGMHEIWNWRLLNKVDEYYVANYLCRTSTNRELYGRGELKAYILALLAAFPDARLTADHVCWLGDAQAGYRTALRWTLQGTHEGPGVYGAPTGKRVRLLGITHQLVQNGKFVQEWTVFDEFALLKQLYAPA